MSKARLLLPRALLVLASAQREFLEASDGTRLAVYDVPPDGDCLFSAVAVSPALCDGATQPPPSELRQSAGALRAAAMQLLCPAGKPSEDLELGGLPAALLLDPLHGETGEGYCQRMVQRGEWGSMAEVLALTRVLRRPIRIHLLSDSTAEHASAEERALSSELYGAEEEGAELGLAFGFNHYRAVVADSVFSAEEALR